MKKNLTVDETEQIFKLLRGVVSAKDDRVVRDCVTVVKFIIQNGFAKGKTTTVKPLVDAGIVKQCESGWVLTEYGKSTVNIVVRI